MDAERFARLQRSGERWAGERAPGGTWLLVRVDGRGFSRLTAERYRKPFDEGFHTTMLGVAATLTAELQAVAWYAQSDEITVVLPPRWELFGRRVEKVVSLAAGIASAACSLSLGTPAVFDARLAVAADDEEVTDNLSWRVADANRNCVQALTYWGLRHRGRSAAEATAQLEGVDRAAKEALLRSWGEELSGVPSWQRVGVLQMRAGPGGGHEPVDLSDAGWRGAVRSRLTAIAARLDG